MRKQIKHSKQGEVNTEIRALEIKWFGSNSLLYDNEYHIVTMPLTQDLMSNRKNKKTRTISFLFSLSSFSVLLYSFSLEWNTILLSDSAPLSLKGIPSLSPWSGMLASKRKLLLPAVLLSLSLFSLEWNSLLLAATLS